MVMATTRAITFIHSCLGIWRITADDDDVDDDDDDDKFPHNLPSILTAPPRVNNHGRRGHTRAATASLAPLFHNHHHPDHHPGHHPDHHHDDNHPNLIIIMGTQIAATASLAPLFHNHHHPDHEHEDDHNHPNLPNLIIEPGSRQIAPGIA